MAPDAPLHPQEFACTSPFVGEHGDVLWCEACRLGYSPPPLEAGGVHDMYAETVDDGYVIEEAHRLQAFDSILRDIERVKPPGRLLEIGSLVGLCLVAATRRGWKATGLEPSRWAVGFGRERYGVDLVRGTVEFADLEGERFDCVMMVDVLEHLVDPFACLDRCRKWLKPDGVLALSTVNMQTAARRVLRTRWPWFMRMHLFYFSPHSLRSLLERTGYDVISMRASPRTFRLGYLGERFSMGGVARRLAGRLARSRPLRNIPVTVRTRDLLLVLARPR